MKLALEIIGGIGVFIVVLWGIAYGIGHFFSHFFSGTFR